jgi:hypothetical protein
VLKDVPALPAFRKTRRIIRKTMLAVRQGFEFYEGNLLSW